VKDAAFSAESVTEHVQTLSDGNRLTRKSTAHIYRDAFQEVDQQALFRRLAVFNGGFDLEVPSVVDIAGLEPAEQTWLDAAGDR